MLECSSSGLASDVTLLDEVLTDSDDIHLKAWCAAAMKVTGIVKDRIRSGCIVALLSEFGDLIVVTGI